MYAGPISDEISKENYVDAYSIRRSPKGPSAMLMVSRRDPTENRLAEDVDAAVTGKYPNGGPGDAHGAAGTPKGRQTYPTDRRSNHWTIPQG